MEMKDESLARFWWLRRVSLAMAGICALMLLVWFVEDRYAAVQLEKQLQLYKAAGEPVSIADIPVPSVSEDDNAAAVFIAAASKMSAQAESPRSSGVKYDYELPPVDAWMEMTGKAVEANGEPLRLVRGAAGRSGADWGTRFSSPLIAVPLPHLAPQRGIANLMADAAVYHHVLGDDREAVAVYRTIQHQADALCVEPILLSQLVGMNTDALADASLGQFAGEIRVDDGTSGCLTREEVGQLIRELLERQKRDILPALRIERLSALDTYDLWCGNQYTTRPLNRADVPPAMQSTDQLIEASSTPTCQQALALLAELRRGSSWFSAPSETLRPIRDMRPSSHALAKVYRGVLLKRVLAIQLAARLYALDNARYPKTLEDLVPEYLPRVPANPMSPAPLRYVLLAEGRRPMICSGPEPQALPARFQWDEYPSEADPTIARFDLSAWKSGEPRLWEGPPEVDAGTLWGPDSVEELDKNTGHAAEEGQQPK